MPTKTVSLDEEAYEQLKARKQEGESFSQVVKRLAGERSWSEVAGILVTMRRTRSLTPSRRAIPIRRAKRPARRGVERRGRRHGMIQDTTFIIDVLRGDSDATERLELIEKDRRPEKISSMTVLELYEGVARTQTSHDTTEQILDILDSKSIINADTTVMRKAGKLSGNLINRGQRIDREDCVIAATALLTTNRC
jgi:Predicted nucleic acid-binding protein, contains PIN domain